MSTVRLNDSDLGIVCHYVAETCGIQLDYSKAYLIEARLSEICEELELESYKDLVSAAKEKPLLQNNIVDRITTNETLFFRDSSPFQALQHKAVPELIDAKEGTSNAQRLRVWSAACSTGQEAYSIAMTLYDLIPGIHSWDVKILGSDVSSAAVAQASRGIYTSLEVERGLPESSRQKFFTQEGDQWKVKDNIRSLCSFEQRNLTKPILGVGPFDIVFCRNVAIYFSPEDRKQLFERIANNMTTDSYLFVGSSESLGDLGSRYQPQHHCRSVFYRPNLR